MKDLKFKTIAGKTHEIKFSENDFLLYIENCYNHLNLEVEIALFINNLHSDKLNKLQVFDSCDPDTIKCNFSQKFLKEFAYIADAGKYNL